MQFKGMMVGMLDAHNQEKQLYNSMVNIIRSDLAVLQRRKISKLVGIINLLYFLYLL